MTPSSLGKQQKEEEDLCSLSRARRLKRDERTEKEFPEYPWVRLSLLATLARLSSVVTLGLGILRCLLPLDSPHSGDQGCCKGAVLVLMEAWYNRPAPQ